MATKDKVAVVEEVVEVDYSKLTKDALLQAMGTAFETAKAGKDSAANLKLMGQLSKLYTKRDAEDEKVKKDTLLAELVKVTRETLIALKSSIDEMVEDGKLEGAEGVWFAYDLCEVVEAGINPSCRLVKSGRKATGAGESTGKSSYIPGLPPSAEMLKEVADQVYFAKDTPVDIDKKQYTMPAGMTYQEAYEFSTNGGWRNRVRMALGKATGLVGAKS